MDISSVQRAAAVSAGRPWPARVATFAIFYANGFGIGAWAGVIPQIKAMLMLNEAQLSLALLAMAAGAIVTMPLAGLLTPRFGGTGRTVRGAAAVFGLALLLPGWVPGLPLLILAALFIGIGNGLMEVPMNAHASVVERDWGRPIMSSFHAGWSFGGLSGSATMGLLIGAGLPTPMLLVAAGLFVLVAGAIAGIWLGPGEVPEAGGPAFAWPERRILRYCLIILLTMMVEGAMADWSAVYLTGVAAMTPATAAGGYSAYAGAMLFGRSIGDGVLHALGRRLVLIVGPGLSAAGMLLAVLVPHPGAAIAGFCLVGLGIAPVVPALFSASAALSSSPALGIAMASTVGYGGFLFGPPLIGSIATLAGLRVSFLFLSLALAVAVPLTLMERRRAGG